jgi:hypothetical protein
VGLENGDGVEVIDPAANRVIARMPGGQAPQALVYLSHVAAPGSADNLSKRVNQDSQALTLKAPSGPGRGLLVARQLGVVDALEVTVFKLKPATQYSVYLGGQLAGSLRTDAKGMAAGTMIGPVRTFAQAGAAAAAPDTQRILVMEGAAAPDPAAAVLAN